MALTEVKLNGVYYKTKRLPTQVLANQMASKVGQGTSEYGDLTTWSAWIQQDWQEGVGKVKPHLNGGFLYGEVESRVPGQLILPQHLTQVDTRDILGTTQDCRYMPSSLTGSVTVGTGGYARVATKFTTPASIVSAADADMLFYADIPYGVEATFAIYTDSSGPNTLIDTGVYSPMDEVKGFQWIRPYALSAVGVSSNTAYWLVIYPTNSAHTIQVGYGTSGYNAVAKSYNGSVWADIASTYLIYTSAWYPATTLSESSGAGFFRFNGTLYLYQDARVYKFDSTNDQWDSVGAITDHHSVTGVVAFEDKAWFGNAGVTTTDYTTMSTSETFTSTGLNGSIFAKHNGLLWRGYADHVEYSDDGTTWEPTASSGDPVYVTSTDFPITGMAGLGDNMYVSTAEGLLCIYPGDIVRSVIQWGAQDDTNGRKMVNYDGALYITVNGRVSRFTEDGSLQDIWMTREDDLVSSRIGSVWSLCRMNNWLLAYVGGRGVGLSAADLIHPSIWLYQNNSWHCIAVLPVGLAPADTATYFDYNIYYDRPTSKLWAVTPGFVTYYWRMPDLTLNPYNDTASRYTHNAWVEWDWFDGAILEAPKDYESVTIIGENLDATCYVKVYWKDDDSTAWELLGTCDSNIEELRWTIAMGTRPNTRRFKLGLLLVSLDDTQTPRIRAVRVKYHLMVRDWFRWNVIVDVSGRSGAYQMLADGTRNTLTAEQIKDNIDALAKRTPPFLYQDVDGTQYEVKITDANFTYDKWENNEKTSTSWWEGTYNLQLEQVTNSAYA